MSGLKIMAYCSLVLNEPFEGSSDVVHLIKYAFQIILGILDGKWHYFPAKKTSYYWREL